jgi:GMP synthase-like glutamine amidotransferase
MILIVDMNWKKQSLAFYEFVLPIVSVVQPLEECVVKHFSEIESSELGGFSKIILSGTALKDQATIKQTEKFEWLKTCNKPLMGICAGMQTMSLVFGESLTPCLQIGMTEVVTQKENPLFQGAFQAYMLHNYSLQPPQNFDVLATSLKCIQAIKHKSKSIYGVLFHPEVRNPEILKHFIQLEM